MNYEMISAVELRSRLAPLFDAYQQWLIQNDPDLQIVLNGQSYDDELEHLQEKYAAPEGAIYILSADGEDIGCIALRKIDEKTCEVKRVFLQMAYRGKGLGRLMMERVIEDARRAGYREMVLDTLPIMKGACGLYDRMGFVPTEKYNDNPLPYAIFRRLML